MELSGSNILSKEIFSYISGKVKLKSKILKKLLKFHEVTMRALKTKNPPQENFGSFRKRKPWKNF